MTNQLPRRSYLGFEVSAQERGTSTAWLVSEVDPDSPAERAGLRLGDEVLELGGRRIESLEDLRRRAAAFTEGGQAKLTIRRDETCRELALEASRMPLEPISEGRVLLDEVLWSLPSGGEARLRAIWTVPRSQPPYPAVWLLPSAAWISQETPLETWQPAYRLIEALTSAGMATLRVDRSGLGDSEGPPCTELDFVHELSMWEAARSHFLSSPLVRDAARYLFGRSLGGILAPLLACQQPLSGVAVWGTTSQRWHEASLASAAYQLRLRGVTGPALLEELERMAELQSLVYLDELTPAEAHARAPSLRDTMADAFQGNRVHDRIAGFFHQLQRQDVEEAWTQVGCPVLAVHAEYDTLTQARDLQRIVELAGGGGRFVELTGVDHFMHARTSLEEAVRTPWGGEFSPKAAQVLIDFFRDPTS